MARYLDGIGISSLLVDNRAAGRSEVDGPFTLRDMQEDVLSLWSHLDVKKTAVLGISMGGFISLGITCHERRGNGVEDGRISHLILVSTAQNESWIKPASGGWVDNANMIEDRLRCYFAPGFVERNQLLFQTMVKQTRSSILEGNFAERSVMQRDAVRAGGLDFNLGDIEVPTLVVHGDQDQIIDVGAAHELNARIRGSELALLPGLGHLILAENPKLLYDMVAKFITR
jgi:pimeloyl-ACP methyl ester carboxylesterase